MPTPAQIDAEIKLERQGIIEGKNKLIKNTKSLEQKEYASASIYGVVSIDNLLPAVISRFDATIIRLKKGHVGVAAKEIITYFQGLEKEVVITIGLKTTIDNVFSPRQDSKQVTKIAETISYHLENECMLRYYEAKYPGLLHSIKKNYWHQSSGTHQKVRSLKTIINRADIDHWKSWGTAVKVRLGVWVLDCICTATGYFEKNLIQCGKKTKTILIPTPEFIENRDEIMRQAELFSAMAYPMLVPPNNWERDGSGGGYILNELMRSHQMVRRGEWTPIQGTRPVEFLNQIQQTSHVINKFTADVSEQLEELGISVGKFIPIVEIPFPPKPPNIAEDAEARQDYRRRAAEVCNKNAQAYQKSCRTRMTMNAMKMFKDKTFYHCWSFCYRGRTYPIATVLSVQDCEWAKSLLKFAEPAKMNHEAELWLAFHCATTYGLDKDTMADRITWAMNNEELITKVATDPIGNISEWEGCDSPWMFIAAAEEYYHCVIKKDRETTNLPVAVDATASGLQVLAGLCKCKSTATLTNVTPSDKPQDAYKVIAEFAKPNCPEHLREHICRKITKKTVMTVPYNSSAFSSRHYIREAFKEKNIDIDKDDLTEVVKAVRGAMDEIFPGPMQVMKWIKLEVSTLIKNGATEIRWITPSGFKVTQRLNKSSVKRITLKLLGSCKLHVADGEELDNNGQPIVDLNHHKNATSPNLIHSLDASILHLSATNFQHPISLIHDSVLCRAPDLSLLSSVVREAYMHIFARQDYLKEWAKQIGATTEPPMINTLKPETVIQSTYFFC